MSSKLYLILAIGACVLFGGFQNCSKATFVSPTETVQSDSTATPASLAPDTKLVSKINVSILGDSLITKDQKLFFNSQVGENLKISLVRQIDENSIVILLGNNLSSNTSRKAKLKATI